MMLNILTQFNWVDIFVLIILIRIGYIAMKNGFVLELFKLLGTISAIYLSLHYFRVMTDFVNERIPIKKMPLEFFDFLSFVILAILGYFIFLILRRFFHRLIKMEAVPNLNRWGSLILGIIRGILFSSLVTFILVISTWAYLKNSVNNSYLGKRMFKIAPQTYGKLWDGLTSKFMTKEKFNKTVLEIQENLSP